MFNDDKLTPAQRKMLQEADDNADKVYMDDPDNYFQKIEKRQAGKRYLEALNEEGQELINRMIAKKEEN